jgi:drug/metabolite transporter superfamily protein YnfA
MLIQIFVLILYQTTLTVFTLACYLEIRGQDKSYLFWRGLQEQRPQAQKSVLGSSTGVYVFCSSETVHERMATRTNLFVLAGNYMNKGHDLENL